MDPSLHNVRWHGAPLADINLKDLSAPIDFSQELQLRAVPGSPDGHHFLVFHRMLSSLGEVNAGYLVLSALLA
jgi:hypothetical protein